MKMKLIAFLFLSSLIALASCNGQSASRVATGHTNYFGSASARGDTVSELSKSIWLVFQDSKGNYWFGSDTDGVYRFDGKTAIQFSVGDGLSSNRVRGIQEDSAGNIYITTLEGINKFDGFAFSTLNIVENNRNINNWKLNAGDLWFHTLGRNGESGPCRYDGKDLYPLKFPEHYLAEEYYKRFPKNPWSPYDVYYIYKDSKGAIWFGTGNFGACRYDGKTFNWLYEDHLTNTPSGGSFGIRSIIEDKEGKFWLCNTRYRFSISSDSVKRNGTTFVKYEKEKGIEGIKSQDGTDGIYFLSAVKDDKGDLWMATYREGVWHYDGKKMTHYPVKDGAKDITVFSIYKDKQGALWLGTHETGVYKFNGTSFDRFKLPG